MIIFLCRVSCSFFIEKKNKMMIAIILQTSRELNCYPNISQFLDDLFSLGFLVLFIYSAGTYD